MNKKIIQIFISTCLMLTMLTTTVFAATTEISDTSIATSANLASNTKSKTFHHNIYKDGELILKITSHVSGYSNGTYINNITDVSIDLTGPMANKCRVETTYQGGISVAVITTADLGLIATLGYRITNKGIIKCDIEKYVK